MYTPKPVDLNNIGLPSYDVKFKYFIYKKAFGENPTPVSGSNFYSASYGKFNSVAISNNKTYGIDGIVPSDTYAEIIVPFNGNFSESYSSESEIDWNVSLSDIPDQNYQPRNGDQIMCYRKIINPNTINDSLLAYFSYDTELGIHGVSQGDDIIYANTVADQPIVITESGKYDNSLWISPSATNLVINPSFESGSNFALGSYLNCVVDRTDDNARSGSYSLRMNTSNVSGSFYCEIANGISVIPSTKYTVSAYLWQSASNENKIFMNIKARTSASVVRNTYNSSASSGSGWLRHSISITTASDVNNLIIFASASPVGGSEVYFADAIQVETGTEVTPYLDGNLTAYGGHFWNGTENQSTSYRNKLNTRIDELSFTDIGNYNLSNNGTIMFWANLNSISGSKCLWKFGDYLKSHISGSLLYFYNVLNGLGIAASTGWHHYTYTWHKDNDERKLYIDGSLKSTQSYGTSGSGNLFIGCEGNTSACQPNAAYDDFALLSKTLNSYEISRISSSTSPLCVGNSWHLWWNGIVSGVSYNINDSKKSANVEISSIKKYLDAFESPRISFGSENVSSDASVEASSTLAVPEEEVKNKEFVGAIVDCQPQNVADDRIDSLWISQIAPRVAIEPVTMSGKLIVDEFFCTPVAGWDSEDVFWIELLNTTEHTIYFGRDDVKIKVYSPDGKEETLSWVNRIPHGAERWIDTSFALPPRERMVICQDKRKFEAYNGNAQFADWVEETRTINQNFRLRRKGGYIAVEIYGAGPNFELNDVVCWGKNIEGKDMKLALPSKYTSGWNSATALSEIVVQGATYRRKPTGVDNDLTSDWFVESYGSPGNGINVGIFEWLKLELKDSETKLDRDYDGSNTLNVTELKTWPSNGRGVIDGLEFTYTSRSESALYLSASLSGTHIKDTALYPLDNSGVAMTGWLLDSIEIERKPGLEPIKYYNIMTSKYADRATPSSDPYWELDYDQPLTKLDNVNGNNKITRSLRDANGNPVWVKTVIIPIWEMGGTSPGRAKINTVKCILSNMAVATDSEFKSVKSRISDKVIAYLLDTHTDLDSNEILKVDYGKYWGAVGDMQLAISKLPEAISGICEASGCVVRYSVDGNIIIERNPWWPGGMSSNQIDITTDKIIDSAAYSNDNERISGVKLFAKLTDGTPANEVTVPPSASGLGIIEFTDYVVYNQDDAQSLAWNLYWKEKNKQKIEIKVNGPGTGLFVGQKYNLVVAGSPFGNWLCESVNTNWSMNASEKSYETSLGLRKYF